MYKNMLIEGEMEFKSWDSYRAFRNSIAKESRYIFSEETESFLRALLSTSKGRVRVLKKGTILWRAQIGNDLRPEYDGDELIGHFPTAYSSERMKPFKDSASDGRANPKGIPCLYVATDEKTAMSEVRPWIGSIISLGQFSVAKELKIIDFSIEHGEEKYFFFTVPSEEEKIQAVWSHIDNAFSRPVTESDFTSDYAPTQVIAEYIKSKGYDGIQYKSSLAKGHNIALFDIESANIKKCDTYEVKSLHFDFTPTDNLYYVDRHGKNT